MRSRTFIIFGYNDAKRTVICTTVISILNFPNKVFLHLLWYWEGTEWRARLMVLMALFFNHLKWSTWLLKVHFSTIPFIANSQQNCYFMFVMFLWYIQGRYIPEVWIRDRVFRVMFNMVHEIRVILCHFGSQVQITFGNWGAD